MKKDNQKLNTTDIFIGILYDFPIFVEVQYKDGQDLMKKVKQIADVKKQYFGKNFNKSPLL